VNFLMHCDLVFRDLLHCVFWFSLFLPGAELPLPAAANSGRGNNDKRRESSENIVQTATETDSTRN
jgi:hypothetical protein